MCSKLLTNHDNVEAPEKKYLSTSTSAISSNNIHHFLNLQQQLTARLIIYFGGMIVPVPRQPQQ